MRFLVMHWFQFVRWVNGFGVKSRVPAFQVNAITQSFLIEFIRAQNDIGAPGILSSVVPPLESVPSFACECSGVAETGLE